MGNNICAGIVRHGHADFAKGFGGEGGEGGLHPGDGRIGADVGGIGAGSCKDEGMGMLIGIAEIDD